MSKRSKARIKPRRVKVLDDNALNATGEAFVDPETGLEFIVYTRADTGEREVRISLDSVAAAIGFDGDIDEWFKKASTTVIPGSNPPTTYVSPDAKLIRVAEEDGWRGN